MKKRHNLSAGDNNSRVTIRTCALDSGSLTADTGMYLYACLYVCMYMCILGKLKILFQNLTKNMNLFRDRSNFSLWSFPFRG